MRSLTKIFDDVVVEIKESKDLLKYSFDELMCFLLAHENKLNKSAAKVEEKAFWVKEEFFYKEKSKDSRGRGRGGFCG